MKPAISEFSFGYAITESIITELRSVISGAPIFPSLREEGKSGGGYDLKLNRSSVPLFLQFKLSHRMVRKNCFERRVHRLFSSSFYRIPLMPLKLSNQHNYLLDLDDGINEVYYVAPFFSNQIELNKFYTAGTVIENSAFIRPQDIGRLPDNNDHHISLQPNGNAYLCSKKPRIMESILQENIIKAIDAKFEKQNEPLIETLTKLEVRLKEIIRQTAKGNSILIEEKVADKLDPLNSVTFLARYFLGCEFLLVTK